MASRKWAVCLDETVISVQPRPALPFELEYDDEGEAYVAAIAAANERRASAKLSLQRLRRQHDLYERRRA